ncbi:hypothetical protein PYCCODRAFT_27083 [Trametes coccinea BRFM310]|uniref:Uncharacterized protein n=1 Tax=Trametes coccinea (strain BRFM310) TaxID=1353009 RepID=A0A1Y2J595_TRAC3|nr:hypothetical protein PYCCODRAFT_27083 [Trametes coccinea BRFM310]
MGRSSFSAATRYIGAGPQYIHGLVGHWSVCLQLLTSAPAAEVKALRQTCVTVYSRDPSMCSVPYSINDKFVRKDVHHANEPRIRGERRSQGDTEVQ